MDESLRKLLDEGLSVLLFVSALSAFAIMSLSLSTYMNSRETLRMEIRDDNDFRQRVEGIRGDQVLMTLVNNDGRTISVYNGLDVLLYKTDKKSELTDLGFIKVDHFYKINYRIRDGIISELIYKEEP